MRSQGDLVNWVQSRLDEVAPYDQVASVPYATIIFELNEAVNQLIRTAPAQYIYCLSEDISNTIPLIDRSRNVAIIPLKDSFLRFLRGNYYNWIKKVDILTPVESIDYQNIHIPKLAPTIHRPIISLIPFVFKYNSTGGVMRFKHALEFIPNTIDIDSEGVTTTPDPDDEDGISLRNNAISMGLTPIFSANIGKVVRECIVVNTKDVLEVPDKLHDSIIWLTVSRILTSLRLPELSGYAYKNYLSTLGLS